MAVPLLLLLPLPTSCRWHSHPLRALGTAETPRVETGFEVPLPAAAAPAPQALPPASDPAPTAWSDSRRPFAASDGFFPLPLTPKL